MSELIDGKFISKTIELDLKTKIADLRLSPKLIIIQIGNKEESNTYIKHKIAFAERIGAVVEYKKYAETVAEESVIADIKNYNTDSSVNGIIVQLPVPPQFSATKILETIVATKDVDGLTSASTNSLLRNEPGFVSGATQAVLKILEIKKIDVTGKRIVVVGHSALVGKPTALALMNRNATVTVCHEFTKDLATETKRADILITAVGKPNLITTAHVSAGQMVIDIGITVTADKKVVGDVDFEAVKDIVAAITPVPGGIGPMTIACLFENLVTAAAVK